MRFSIDTKWRIALMGCFVLVWAGCFRPPVAPPPTSNPCLQNADCQTGSVCQAGTCVKTGGSDQESSQSERPSDDSQPDQNAPPDAGPDQLSDAGPDGGFPETIIEVKPPEPCDTPNEKRECYFGPAGTKDKGICTAGQQICQGNKTWSECFGQELPAQESCNGKDDNCDGQIDETFARKGEACQDLSQQGACQQGTITSCQNGKEICTSNTKPTQEICDNQIDDDCNGVIDDSPPCTCKNGATRPCGSNTGACREGLQTCTGGQWGDCVGETKPAPIELCDGIDNDCDGQTDETFTNLGQPCAVGQGACQSTGKFICSTDKGSTECSAKAGTASAELCDGIDNDCDGKVDEGFEKLGTSCTAGQGACQSTGKFICSNDKKQLACDATPGTPSQEQCNGKDDDCDGKTDEDYTGNNQLSRSCYTGPANTAGVGLCRTGTQTCTNGSYGACQNEVKPAAKDKCNNQDDNCNGSVNDNCACTGVEVVCGSNVGECKQGLATCLAGVIGACIGEVKAVSEKCDGKDNNCNGQTDEGFGLGNTCTTGTGGCTRTGKIVCKADGSGSECNATGSISASPEKCDGVDNDCDGQVDEGLSGGACKTGKSGPCANGRSQCTNGTYTCAQTTQPKTEICRNNIDDDCDGAIDEICGPLYAYAWVTGTSFFKQRSFSKLDYIQKGVRDLTPSLPNGTDTSTSQNCSNTPIFLSPNNPYMMPLSYSCNGSKYRVYTHDTFRGSNPSRLEDRNFLAVIPGKNDTYAIVNTGSCPNNKCQLNTNNGQTGKITEVRRVQKGLYRISSTLCSESNRPIFATINSSRPNAFVQAFKSQSDSYCYFSVYDRYENRYEGKYVAIWLPDTKKTVWATIDGQRVLASNTPNDTSLSWSAQTFSSSSYCPTAGQCSRTKISHPAWANVSIGLTNAYRTSPFTASSFYLWNYSGPNSNYDIAVTTFDDDRGRVTLAPFSVIFVQ